MNTFSHLKFSIATIMLLALTACAAGNLLNTRYVKDLGAESGTFRLILYGGKNTHDYETVAILDRENDPYTIVPFGEDYSYRLVEHVSMAEAVRQGQQFIGNTNFYRTMESKSIIGPDGSVIGYELRPLYMSLFVGGTGDVLSTSYLLKEGNTVVAYIHLDYQFQHLFDGRPGVQWGS